MKRLILPLLAVFVMGSMEQKIAIERRLEERVNNIIRSVDASAFGLVEVTYQKESVALPASPFKITGSMNINGSIASKISAVKVEVFTTSGEIVPDLRAILQNSARPYFDKVDIVVSKAPGMQSHDGSTWSDPGYVSAAGVGLAIIAMAFFAGLIVLVQRRTAGRAIQGLGNIAASLESFGGSKARSTSSKNETSSSATASVSESDSDAIIDLPSNAVLALLMDSYWCKRDGYASYLWRRLQVKVRFELLDKEKLLKEYVDYIQSVEPSAGAYHLEAYYLSPLSINHVDNAVLAEVIRKEPALFFVLPSMRSEAVDLTSMERINILQMHSGVAPAKTKVDFAGLEMSKHRTLRKTIHFQIHSLEDEKQILEQDVPLEIMSQIPTLGLAARLQDDILKNILKEFSAQELAEAWIGPDDVLKRFGNVLPEKKLTLLANYRKSVQPSRDSEAFLALRDQIIASVEQHQSSGNTAASDDTESISAA